MEPISIIIAALVSGMLRAVTRSAQDVIYEGLSRPEVGHPDRHADQGGPALVQATKALEEQPNAELGRAVLPMELERVGAEATAPNGPSARQFTCHKGSSLRREL